MFVTATAVVAAIIFFVAGNIAVFAGAPLFVQYFYDPRTVALTHVFTLGWVSLMIVGVLRQLAPVAFGLELRGENFLKAVILAWLPGILAMVAGLTYGWYAITAAGTTAILFGAVIFVWIILDALSRKQSDVPHRCLTASVFYFGGAAILGAWMGLAKGVDLPLPAPFHRVLFAHIHLAGAGWAGMMIIAVMSRLFPQPHIRHPYRARVRFYAFNAGLIGLTIGLLLDATWYGMFGAVLAIACMWYAAAFVPVLCEFWKADDRSTFFLVTAWTSFGLTAAAGLWFAVGNSPPTERLMQAQFAYGFVYLFGWLTLMILGMLYRIIPTHLSKLLTSRGLVDTVGLRRILENSRLQTAAFASLVLGLTTSISGVVIQEARIFRIGWALWLFGLTAFFTGVFRLARGLRTLLKH
jgi:hypothetical protein